MILYQLTRDGIPVGAPKPEHEIDRIIKRTKQSISNELEKVAVKPELTVVGGGR